ncbi:MAG: DEAD/DEAH box helicase [Cyanophyceae cyanobacterium]
MTVSPSSADPAIDLDLKALFPFDLDEFQLRAIAALNAGKSTVVCAPTGSGKTLVGEYAIYRALSRGKRVFYTTPLKALSNQKFRDFRDQFGNDRAGLLTGDISINRDAPIVVMTTEIFRNMLYGTPIGQVGTSLRDVEVVVLDECHYMNDSQRGTVWEESIVYCPNQVQIVALSATVANSDQLTDWLNYVHGPTELIDSDYRPVPLRFSFGNYKGLFPLLDETGTRLHPQFKGDRKRRRKAPGEIRRDLRAETPDIAFVLSQLKQKDMLPAIYFIFSRRGCDRAVSSVGPLSLVSAAEAAELKRRIDHFIAENPSAIRDGQLDPLYRGIAAHHAGILPAWKAFVEELFQSGLIKVVFATETLAAGINMPARTTVISSLSKRTDRGHRLLNASEFLQMSGRAGRRGMDIQGYVVALQTPFEGAKEAAHLATSQADPLVSQFTPTYGMVLNLLQTHSLEEARSLIERSFGQYLSTLHLIPQQRELDALRDEVVRLRAQLDEVDAGELASYEKLRQRLRAEQRLLKTLRDQAEVVRGQHLAPALQFAVAGTILQIQGKAPEPLTATLVTKVKGSGQFPWLVCLAADNRWYAIATEEVVSLHGEYPRLRAVDDLSPPEDLFPFKPGQSRRGDEETLAIVRQMPAVPDPEEAPEVLDQLDRVEEVEALLENHPVHQWQNRKNLFKRVQRLDTLREELRDREAALAQLSDRYWQEFVQLMDILTDFDCLVDYKPTPLGEAIATLRGENELWLGLALTSGDFDDLDPQHLAAACAALLIEEPRPDTWTDAPPSNRVLEVVGNLQDLRRDILGIQRSHRVLIPLCLEDQLIGLVEHWALGMEWADLVGRTSLDDGDVVRILRRTLDLLSQVVHMPHVPEELKANAGRARDLIDRFPVAEAT